MPTNQPDGFLALPNGGQGAPVLVLHAWWGLNDTIKGLCTRLADAGFVAFAPDLYHGRVAATIEGAEALAQTLDSDGAAADVARAVAFLYERAGRPAGGQHHQYASEQEGLGATSHRELSREAGSSACGRRARTCRGTGCRWPSW